MQHFHLSHHSNSSKAEMMLRPLSKQPSKQIFRSLFRVKLNLLPFLVTTLDLNLEGTEEE